jgi:hypothetical protein
MQVVKCPSCISTFHFDPDAVWTSPGTLKGPQPGLPVPVVIQCPQCKQSVRIDLKPTAPDRPRAVPS